MFAVILRQRFVRTFKKLDRAVQQTITDELDRLARNPFHHPNIRRLAGTTVEAYRLRVGRWRILYFLIQNRETIEVIDLFMKKSSADYHRRLF